mgnify:CR=1 FL=1
MTGTLSFVYYKGKLRRWHPHEDRFPLDPGPVEDTPLCDACDQPITDLRGGAGVLWVRAGETPIRPSLKEQLRNFSPGDRIDPTAEALRRFYLRVECCLCLQNPECKQCADGGAVG